MTSTIQSRLDDGVRPDPATIRLPHGLYDYVKKAEKAVQNPAQDAVLLGEVLRHAADAAPSDNSKPDKRDPATHAVYRAIATWNTESDIVKFICATPREMVVSSQSGSGLGADEKQVPESLSQPFVLQ